MPFNETNRGYQTSWYTSLYLGLCFNWILQPQPKQKDTGACRGNAPRHDLLRLRQGQPGLRSTARDQYGTRRHSGRMGGEPEDGRFGDLEKFGMLTITFKCLTNLGSEVQFGNLGSQF